MEEKDLYINENEKGLVKENEIFNIILNKTFCELYQEYLNSNEFKIDEINRIKIDNANDDYIKRYKDIAMGLIKFFSK